MAELGTIERAYADGYAAAQAEIERLRKAVKEIADSEFFNRRQMLAREALAERQSRSLDPEGSIPGRQL